jgi:hypothetical protein
VSPRLLFRLTTLLLPHTFTCARDGIDARLAATPARSLAMTDARTHADLPATSDLAEGLASARSSH